MPDWMGAIGSYIVLMAVAEIPGADSLAIAIAWAIAIGVGYMLVANKQSLVAGLTGRTQDATV